MIASPGLASILVLASIFVGDRKAIDCKIGNAFTETYVPYRAIVKTRNKSFADDREAMRQAIASKLGTTPQDLTLEEIDDEGTFVVDSHAIDISKAPIFGGFVSDDRFEYMERDPYILAHTLVEPNDPFFHNPERPLWGLKEIHAPAAWQSSTGSAEIVAAIVDGGINPDHEDLTPLFKVKAAVGNCPKDSVGYDAISDRCETTPRGSHGTRMAGPIGAHGNNLKGVSGVNWTIGLLSATFMENGIGCAATAAAALEYVWQAKDAEAADIRVVNLSWGTSEDSSALREKLEKLSASGVVLVASAGNDALNIKDNPVYPAIYPLPLLITVASMTQDGNLAGNSNFGPESVHIAAPGDKIYTTSWKDRPNPLLNKNYYKADQGTSIAAAHVTGAVALLASRCPKLKGEDLRALLIDNGTPRESLRDLVKDRRFLNVEEAMVKTIAKCATLVDP
ncbi:MAG TPA: S8 family serine peptidase [Thermoanaerobaculia bacterium]|jgi:subtilisin family serine protease